jgi:acyl transferase domain-containing protein/aryl carrier-like protein
MKESRSDDIAIIGLAGRFPGAASVDEFWRNLVAGVESISALSDADLAASGLDPAAVRNDPGQVAARGILAQAEFFDAAFFGMNARQAEVTDPQQRLFLEAAWEALESAGYDPARIDGPVGVYAGMGDATYFLNNIHPRPDLASLVGERVINLGNEKDYLAAWVAYKLNLRGPAISLNTACSTSLVAVCQACQSLLNFQCDLALAGGVWISFPQHRSVPFQAGGIFSPDGHCRSFDDQAAGTVSSDGLGLVVLKRLGDALDDGDQVLAVIKGCGLNNDGSAKAGFTAPSVDGQAEAIATALAEAGFDPATVSYVECHGTATPIGDPIEIAALTQAFRLGTAEKNFCAIGSVKSNIGHTGVAAGAAGLIKTVLALRHRMLPASLHFSRPNPRIDFATSPFFVNSEARPWENVALPRRAGVSSFGLGGTNAHVVLEEAPPLEPSGPSRPWQLLLLSAKTAPALDAARANLAAHFQANPGLDLADAAFTLQEGRQVFAQRQMLVCRDLDDAVSALGDPASRRVLSHQAGEEQPSVVFMFPGQGAQQVNMGADLYRSESVFREAIDRCAEILLPVLGLDLRQVLYPAPDHEKDAQVLLTETRVTQPALFAFEFALATLWMSWGVKPAAMIGHSVGEYVAACLAGVFSLEDALAVVVQRGQLMQKMPRGAMLALPMPQDELREILPATLSLAAVNAPAQCVVSGPAAEVESFSAASKIRGTLLQTSHAFHSPMMDPILSPFAECVAGVKRSAPNIPFISNVTGTWISDADAVDPHYWSRHLRHTVRFADGIAELLKSESSILLEVGPGTTLGSLARLQAGAGSLREIVSSFSSAREQLPGIASLLTALGRLWLRGVEIDWSGLRAQERRHRISLPTYPFQRERYWIEPPSPSRKAAGPSVPVQPNFDPAGWFYLPAWKQADLAVPSGEGAIAAGKFRWLLFVDEGSLGEKMADALTARTKSVTRVIVGPGYRKIAEDIYAINPEQPGDYDALISDLYASDRIPEKIVHLWSLSSLPEKSANSSREERAQNLGLHSLLSLARAWGGKNIRTGLEIEVILNEVHLVTGAETLAPEKATVLGAAKIIPLEYATIACRAIDLVIPESGSKGEQAIVQQLLDEFSTKPPGDIVAYRAGQRWIKTLGQVRLESPRKVASRLKINGVYLITGGLGGIGLTLAEFLAERVRAKLVLVGRTALPPREEWTGWVAQHGEQDEVGARIKSIQAIEKAGGEVLVLTADVADRDRMREVVAQAETRFGPINGVIHSAGAIDYAGVIQRRTKEDTDEILAAKVQGTLVLDELFRDHGLDFFVLCSTRATAVPDASFGQVGYIAANEFLDAFAFSRKAAGEDYTVAINWDVWRQAGMAERAVRHQTETGRITRSLTESNSLSPAAGAQAFHRILNYGFTQVVVSIADPGTVRRDLSGAPPQPNQEKQTDAAPPALHPRPDIGLAFTPPTNELEGRLARIWQELLGIQEVGVEDNFFDLGGDSLLLLRVQAGILRVTGTELSSAEMFQYPTIAALARRLGHPAAETSSLSAAQNRARLQRAALAPRRPFDQA